MMDRPTALSVGLVGTGGEAMLRCYCLKLTVLILVAHLMGFAMADDAREDSERQFTISPIGWVRKTDATTTIVLDKKYESGLLGLDGFSHVYVFWWFDRNDTPEKRKTLQVHPRGDKRNPLTGVFATRSPRRPNLIALSLCKIVSMEGNVVQIEKIDAFAETPVIDLKPYLPGYDTTDDAHSPDWATKNND
jgi:tRNA-Thr(GGU) m(6)t(6)A37 methyltransferase TsaA